MKRDDIVCACTGVTVGMIQDVIEAGANSLDEVQEATEAGTVCGSCIEELEHVVQTLLNEKNRS